MGVVMKLNLMSRLLLFILVPALLGLVLVAGFSFNAARTALVGQIAEEMTLVVERQKSELANVTNLLRDTLYNATNLTRIQALLREKRAGASEQRLAELTRAAQQALSEIAKNYALMSSGGLIDTNGIVVAHTNPQAIGTSRADRAYFKTSLQGQPGTENLYSRGTKKLATILSAPVTVDGQILGVLFTEIDLDSLSKTTTDTIRLGSSGICYLYDSNGLMLAHPNKEYLGDDDSQQPWTREILEKGNGRIEYTWDGLDKVAYFREIPEMDWHLVLAVEREDMLRTTVAMLRSELIIVVIIAVIVGLVIFFVARGIAKPMRNGALFADHVAKGNLDIPPDMRNDLESTSARTDEIGLLARSIGNMVLNLRSLFEQSQQKTKEPEQCTAKAQKAMAEADEARKAAESAKREGMLAAAAHLEEVVDAISAAAADLSTQIAQCSHGADEQAARAAETATAMEEMNSTVAEVARNASSASEISARTREKAAEGSDIVEKAVHSIREVQSQSLSLKDDMEKLSEHARSISRIMGVISDIADQTNLLALNAAIEAARAGEAGRGFAVVADEVRKLAEKTMASTNDVAQAIKAIQDSASQSSRQVDMAVESIDEATQFAVHSGEALAEIVNMADSSADQVRAIATASEQQSATSEEINRAVTHVNTIAGETARAMDEADRAVTELAKQTQTLNELIAEMKRS